MDPHSITDLVNIYTTFERLMNKATDNGFKVLMGMEMDCILRLVDREGVKDAFEDTKAYMDAHSIKSSEEANAYLRAFGIDPEDPEQVTRGLVAAYAMSVKAEQKRKEE